MSNVLIDRQKIDILANAISDKSGVPVTMTLDEMLEAVDGIETGGEPTLQAKTYTVDSAGTATVTADSGYDGLSEVEVSVPQAAPYVYKGSQYVTQNNSRKWQVRGICDIDDEGEDHSGYIGLGTYYSNWSTYDAVPANTSVTPTESAQTIGGTNTMMEGAVTVNAIPSNYVGSGITRRSSTDLTASGATVTVPSGYYASSATKQISNGSAEAITKNVSPSISVSNAGLITANVSSSSDEDIVYSAGYFSANRTTSLTITGSATEQLETQGATTITPSTSQQTAVAAGKYTTGAVTVAAMPSGTAGTPTATKGSVSNHSVSVTPSVTNTTGYITGSTKTGTAVTVSASELASGNKAITSNGTNIDVVGYSTVSVDVQGGGGTPLHVGEVDATSTTASISFTGLPSEPTSFFISFVGGSSIGLPTGTPYKTIDVVYDGTNDFGNIATNITNAQASYSTNFSHSYSNGTLTVTGTESNFIGHYLMLYSYGGGAVDTKDVQVGSGVTSITFTGLEAEPAYWSCAFKSNFGTSSGYQRTIAVAYGYDSFGSGLSGYDMSTVVGLSTTVWTASYNNGSLTITSQGTNAGGYFHQPGYYQLTYAYDDGSGGNYQSKTVTPTTSQQVVEADTGYDALKKVTVNAIPSEYIVPSGNINITSNTATGQTLNVAQYATATVAVPTGGGSVNIATATMTNSSNQNTTISFTLPSGRTPKAFFARLTSQIARNSNSRYYYVFDMRWDGSSTGGVAGNTFYMYSGTLTNVTSGYSYSQSGTTFTLSSTGSRSASPGSFYNGTYELVYIY